MGITVKLDDIINGMEFQSDESTSYLNTKTGEMATIDNLEFSAAENNEPIENFSEWEHENLRVAKEILQTDDYISLPSKFDIHEYEIMERFCLSIADDELRDTISRALKGSGAFRRFKDNIHQYNIADEWYKYRDEAIKQIAIDWCKENDILN
ncbi:hypothetical protein KAR34_07145 [bacterium]|nr:hypothetical protein [bacterium]